MTVTTDEQGFISAIYEEKIHEDLHTCLFACFLSQEEPKRITNALKDPAWVEAMQEELLQFHLQQVWTLVDLPRGKRAISTKWVFRNKKDERGIVIRNKARLVAHWCTQEEGIDYDEFFALVARIEAVRLFLAYASFMGFLVYQMDVKSAFLYRRIKEEVYVCQPSGFEDPDYLNKVYKVEKALYGLYQAPRAWKETVVATSTTEAEYVAAASCCGQNKASKTQTKAKPYGPSSPRTSSKGGPGCHSTMGDSPVQARPKRLSNLPNKPPLREGNTSRSEERSMQILELMAICTKRPDKVTHLENELTSTKVFYNKALINLTKRVKMLEKKPKHKRRRAVIDSSEEEKASLDHENSPK
uniref:Putative ribonuclease H-like domain-containing protein n=1 Tax=Tanacetum cinerariifolium TaxID=118510 RepID=A0A699HL25_TANCI|nr:putative ribonuclease H-like domain-containing protein [Tanacetum cinerariifolium]